MRKLRFVTSSDVDSFNNREQWRTTFAWFPVTAEGLDYRTYWVWLEKVDTKVHMFKGRSSGKVRKRRIYRCTT